MRGSKSGLEKQIKEKLQPNLLDVDGHSCHHIHDAAKKFTKHFDAHLELPFINIYNDFKWSEDVRAILKEICFQMNAKSICPKLYVATRSVCNVIENFKKIIDINILFYYSFLNADDLYRKNLDDTFNRLKVSHKAKA